MTKIRKFTKFKITDIVIAFVFTLFFISLGTIITLSFRPLYYFDIGFLNIPESTGYSKELIKRNYDTLIDYNSPFYKGDLEFPDFKSSPQGLQHFVEVKELFMGIYILFLITLALCLFIIIYKDKKKEDSYLLVSSIGVLAFPLIIGLITAIDFNKTFILFHKIFFRNDYWNFHPELDPVINILPKTFFFHSLILILLILMLGSLSLLIRYKTRKPKST